jgi:hypothetical protein
MKHKLRMAKMKIRGLAHDYLIYYVALVVTVEAALLTLALIEKL